MFPFWTTKLTTKLENTRGDHLEGEKDVTNLDPNSKSKSTLDYIYPTQTEINDLDVKEEHESTIVQKSQNASNLEDLTAYQNIEKHSFDVQKISEEQKQISNLMYSANLEDPLYFRYKNASSLSVEKLKENYENFLHVNGSNNGSSDVSSNKTLDTDMNGIDSTTTFSNQFSISSSSYVSDGPLITETNQAPLLSSVDNQAQIADTSIIETDNDAFDSQLNTTGSNPSESNIIEVKNSTESNLLFIQYKPTTELNYILLKEKHKVNSPMISNDSNPTHVSPDIASEMADQIESNLSNISQSLIDDIQKPSHVQEGDHSIAEIFTGNPETVTQAMNDLGFFYKSTTPFSADKFKKVSMDPIDTNPNSTISTTSISVEPSFFTITEDEILTNSMNLYPDFTIEGHLDAINNKSMLNSIVPIAEDTVSTVYVESSSQNHRPEKVTESVSILETSNESIQSNNPSDDQSFETENMSSTNEALIENEILSSNSEVSSGNENENSSSDINSENNNMSAMDDMAMPEIILESTGVTETYQMNVAELESFSSSDISLQQEITTKGSDIVANNEGKNVTTHEFNLVGTDHPFTTSTHSSTGTNEMVYKPAYVTEIPLNENVGEFISKSTTEYFYIPLKDKFKELLMNSTSPVTESSNPFLGIESSSDSSDSYYVTESPHNISPMVFDTDVEQGMDNVSSNNHETTSFISNQTNNAVAMTSFPSPEIQKYSSESPNEIQFVSTIQTPITDLDFTVVDDESIQSSKKPSDYIGEIIAYEPTTEFSYLYLKEKYKEFLMNSSTITSLNDYSSSSNGFSHQNSDYSEESTKIPDYQDQLTTIFTYTEIQSSDSVSNTNFETTIGNSNAPENMLTEKPLSNFTSGVFNPDSSLVDHVVSSTHIPSTDIDSSHGEALNQGSVQPSSIFEESFSYEPTTEFSYLYLKEKYKESLTHSSSTTSDSGNFSSSNGSLVQTFHHHEPSTSTSDYQDQFITISTTGEGFGSDTDSYKNYEITSNISDVPDTTITERPISAFESIEFDPDSSIGGQFGFTTQIPSTDTESSLADDTLNKDSQMLSNANEEPFSYEPTTEFSYLYLKEKYKNILTSTNIHTIKETTSLHSTTGSDNEENTITSEYPRNLTAITSTSQVEGLDGTSAENSQVTNDTLAATDYVFTATAFPLFDTSKFDSGFSTEGDSFSASQSSITDCDNTLLDVEPIQNSEIPVSSIDGIIIYEPTTEFSYLKLKEKFKELLKNESETISENISPYTGFSTEIFSYTESTPVLSDSSFSSTGNKLIETSTAIDINDKNKTYLSFGITESAFNSEILDITESDIQFNNETINLIDSPVENEAGTMNNKSQHSDSQPEFITENPFNKNNGSIIYKPTTEFSYIVLKEKFKEYLYNGTSTTTQSSKMSSGSENFPDFTTNSFTEATDIDINSSITLVPLGIEGSILKGSSTTSGDIISPAYTGIESVSGSYYGNDSATDTMPYISASTQESISNSQSGSFGSEMGEITSNVEEIHSVSMISTHHFFDNVTDNNFQNLFITNTSVPLGNYNELTEDSLVSVSNMKPIDKIVTDSLFENIVTESSIESVVENSTGGNIISMNSSGDYFEYKSTTEFSITNLKEKFKNQAQAQILSPNSTSFLQQIEDATLDDNGNSNGSPENDTSTVNPSNIEGIDITDDKNNFSHSYNGSQFGFHPDSDHKSSQNNLSGSLFENQSMLETFITSNTPLLDGQPSNSSTTINPLGFVYKSTTEINPYYIKEKDKFGAQLSMQQTNFSLSDDDDFDSEISPIDVFSSSLNENMQMGSINQVSDYETSNQKMSNTSGHQDSTTISFLDSLKIESLTVPQTTSSTVFSTVVTEFIPNSTVSDNMPVSTDSSSSEFISEEYLTVQYKPTTEFNLYSLKEKYGNNTIGQSATSTAYTSTVETSGAEAIDGEVGTSHSDTFFVTQESTTKHINFITPLSPIQSTSSSALSSFGQTLLENAQFSPQGSFPEDNILITYKPTPSFSSDKLKETHTINSSYSNKEEILNGVRMKNSSNRIDSNINTSSIYYAAEIKPLETAGNIRNPEHEKQDDTKHFIPYLSLRERLKYSSTSVSPESQSEDRVSSIMDEYLYLADIDDSNEMMDKITSLQNALENLGSDTTQLGTPGIQNTDNKNVVNDFNDDTFPQDLYDDNTGSLIGNFQDAYTKTESELLSTWTKVGSINRPFESFYADDYDYDLEQIESEASENKPSYYNEKPFREDDEKQAGLVDIFKRYDYLSPSKMRDEPLSKPSPPFYTSLLAVNETDQILKAILRQVTPQLSQLKVKNNSGGTPSEYIFKSETIENKFDDEVFADNDNSYLSTNIFNSITEDKDIVQELNLILNDYRENNPFVLRPPDIDSDSLYPKDESQEINDFWMKYQAELHLLSEKIKYKIEKEYLRDLPRVNESIDEKESNSTISEKTPFIQKKFSGDMQPASQPRRNKTVSVNEKIKGFMDKMQMTESSVRSDSLSPYVQVLISSDRSKAGNGVLVIVNRTALLLDTLGFVPDSDQDNGFLHHLLRDLNSEISDEFFSSDFQEGREHSDNTENLTEAGEAKNDSEIKTGHFETIGERHVQNITYQETNTTKEIYNNTTTPFDDIFSTLSRQEIRKKKRDKIAKEKNRTPDFWQKYQGELKNLFQKMETTTVQNRTENIASQRNSGTERPRRFTSPIKRITMNQNKEITTEMPDYSFIKPDGDVAHINDSIQQFTKRTNIQPVSHSVEDDIKNLMDSVRVKNESVRNNLVRPHVQVMVSSNPGNEGNRVFVMINKTALIMSALDLNPKNNLHMRLVHALQRGHKPEAFYTSRSSGNEGPVGPFHLVTSSDGVDNDDFEDKSNEIKQRGKIPTNESQSEKESLNEANNNNIVLTIANPNTQRLQSLQGFDRTDPINSIYKLASALSISNLKKKIEKAPSSPLRPIKSPEYDYRCMDPLVRFACASCGAKIMCLDRQAYTYDCEYPDVS